MTLEVILWTVGIVALVLAGRFAWLVIRVFRR